MSTIAPIGGRAAVLACGAGWLMALRATPTMSVTHLACAIAPALPSPREP